MFFRVCIPFLVIVGLSAPSVARGQGTSTDSGQPPAPADATPTIPGSSSSGIGAANLVGVLGSSDTGSSASISTQLEGYVSMVLGYLGGSDNPGTAQNSPGSLQGVLGNLGNLGSQEGIGDLSASSSSSSPSDLTAEELRGRQSAANIIRDADFYNSEAGRQLLEQNDKFERPISGYPNLSLNFSTIRCVPGLEKAMSALQSADRSEAEKVLKETVRQLDQLKVVQSSRGNGLRIEGEQAAQTRYLTKIATQCTDCELKTQVWAAQSNGSPILLDLNGNGIADVTTPDVRRCTREFQSQGAVWFDVLGRGEGHRTEWLKPNADGLLCCDVNGNGVVDSASELFGDRDGFVDGYTKLALLDQNHDGVLTGAELSDLSVWIDDGNGICDSSELHSASELGITSISVKHTELVSSFTRLGKTYRSWDWFPRAK